MTDLALVGCPAREKPHVLVAEKNPRQVFTLNPYFFGKGDWKDIIEQRKAFVVQITKAYGISLPSGTNTISFFETFEKLKRDPNTVDLISGKTDKEVQDEI